MFDLKTFQVLGRIPAAEDADAIIYDGASNQEAGLVTEVLKDGFLVATPNGTLLVTEVQIESKKRLRARQFAQGYRGLAGKRLG